MGSEFHALFTRARDAIVVVDDDRRCVDANPAACEMFGLTHDEMRERRLDDFTIESPDLVGEAWAAFLERGEQSGEDVWRRGDGETFDAEYSAVANYVPGRHLSVIRDLSPRRALERRLQQASKMEALGRLAGGIAHDFNNLLLVIRGYTDLLERSLPEGQAREDVGEIDAAATRATELVGQLLAFSRQTPLDAEVLDLDEVVAGTQAMLARLLGADVEVDWRPSGAQCAVSAQRGRLEQVIVNLAINARDAMPGGGRLTIATRPMRLGFPERRALDVPPGDYAELSVADEGVGMDEATRDQVFDPFFTTKEEGTGLGLATAYGIVKQAAGEIAVESERGRGTTFRVYLPLAAVAPARAEASDRSADRGSAAGTILLVEDHAEARRLLARVLAERGYLVLQAGRPSEALAVRAAHGGHVHLLVADVVMPEMRGTELAGQLLAAGSVDGVLLMSGYTGEADDGPVPDGMPFLGKPFSLDELCRRVEELVAAARLAA